ncbi:MAG: aminotransferase class V-fold PLP-dependent enzyme, partial [Pseudomonadales bacterium]
MNTSRRQFVTWLGASTLLATRAAGATTPADPRSEFDFPEEKIPMNAANLCPSSRRVAEEVTRYTQLIDTDCSFQNRAIFSELLEASRKAVATPLGVSPDEVALVRNTSEANNIINNGLDLEPGDEIVIWEENHPTNHVAWQVRARRFGLVVKTVSVPPDPSSIDALIEPFRRAIGPRTRVLTVTHVSNVSGHMLPVAELGALCRANGIHFHVD